jgi:aspartokinase-like uncharacterized kinase
LIRAVVKIGGSVASAEMAERWLEAIAESKARIVVVAGGGFFADAVREAQVRHGFSDDAAHDMAILAMQQTAHMLLDRDPHLAPARHLADFGMLLDEGKVPVWMPAELSQGAPDVSRSWDVTSDSLAAWLCGKLAVRDLVLVKSVECRPTDSFEALERRCTVDMALRRMLPTGVGLHIAGPGDLAGARDAFAAGALPGVRIDLRVGEPA